MTERATPRLDLLSSSRSVDSVSSLASAAKPPAFCEVQMLRATTKATSGVARCLKAFDDGAESNPGAIALRGFRSFAVGIQHSEPAWERLEMHRFLQCICTTPQSKRSRNGAPLAPPSPGEWVLDCFVAESYYACSGYGRAVYRNLRSRAVECGYVLTERRRKTDAASAGDPPAKSGQGKRSKKGGGSCTTSVPLLLKILPAGWNAMHSHLAPPAPTELPEATLAYMLRGIGPMPSPSHQRRNVCAPPTSSPPQHPWSPMSVAEADQTRALASHKGFGNDPGAWPTVTVPPAVPIAACGTGEHGAFTAPLGRAHRLPSSSAVPTPRSMWESATLESSDPVFASVGEPIGESRERRSTLDVFDALHEGDCEGSLGNRSSTVSPTTDADPFGLLAYHPSDADTSFADLWARSGLAVL